MKIDIKGCIIANDSKELYDWLGLQATCPGEVISKLEKAKGNDVEVDINSSGGNVFAGSEIYTALRSYKGNVNINIVGLAGSIASVIAMASNCKISPTGLFMIHNVSSNGYGDYKAFEKEVEILKTSNIAISNAYKEKTGLSESELLELMNKETWLNAEQCVNLKFVDGVMFNENKIQLTNGFMINSVTEQKIRGIINNSKNSHLLKNNIEQEKLNLLKLGGISNGI